MGTLEEKRSIGGLMNLDLSWQHLIHNLSDNLSSDPLVSPCRQEPTQSPLLFAVGVIWAIHESFLPTSSCSHPTGLSRHILRMHIHLTWTTAIIHGAKTVSLAFWSIYFWPFGSHRLLKAPPKIGKPFFSAQCTFVSCLLAQLPHNLLVAELIWIPQPTTNDFLCLFLKRICCSTQKTIRISFNLGGSQL